VNLAEEKDFARDFREIFQAAGSSLLLVFQDADLPPARAVDPKRLLRALR